MKILFISNGQGVDYQCDIVFHGLKTLYGRDVYEISDNWFMFNDISNEQKLELYGKGFTIAGLIDPKSKNILTDCDIKEKIKQRYFDLIIYGSIHRCESYFDLVLRHYPKEKIVVIDGEDEIDTLSLFIGKSIYFKRELVKKAKGIYPISFAIPKKKIIDNIKEKTKMLAHIIPGDLSTYVYDHEKDYYNDYAESYFGKTTKKAGWDCLRHYEIMANGCIPYFPNLADCPKETMVSFPKEMILETNSLFENELKDDKILLAYSQKILDYTKQNLTTEAIAKYVIDIVLNQKGTADSKIKMYMQWFLYGNWLLYKKIRLFFSKSFLGKIKRKIFNHSGE
jgi:hypothetical protein